MVHYLVADLKVLEVFVERGIPAPDELYRTADDENNGQVYIRLHHELRGPLTPDEVLDWKRAVRTL